MTCAVEMDGTESAPATRSAQNACLLVNPVMMLIYSLWAGPAMTRPACPPRDGRQGR